jgi:hypothetical protein
MGFWGKATPTLTPTSATPNPHLLPAACAILVCGDPTLIDLDAAVEGEPAQDSLPEAQPTPLLGHRGGGHGPVAIVQTSTLVRVVKRLGLLLAAFGVRDDAGIIYEHLGDVVCELELLGSLADDLGYLEVIALPEPVQAL